MMNVIAAEGDLESIKQKLGGQRTGTRYMKDIMFEAQTSLPTKGHVVQRVLLHLFPKHRSRVREVLH